MSESTTKTIAQLVERFDTAMLITRATDDELHARPMQVADRGQDASLTFATSIDSDLISEIEDDHRAAVTFQDGETYVSLSGMIRLSEDSSRIESLWSPAWKLWFPLGKDDPALRLLEFQPNAGAYWDVSGTDRFSFLVEAGKAILTGEEVREGELSEHGATRMD